MRAAFFEDCLSERPPEPASGRYQRLYRGHRIPEDNPPEGYVTPCPYIPAKAGNIMETGLKEIWVNAEVFKTLRDKKYDGRCKECEYRDICGGCRAKALASASNIMGEDPGWEYEPKGGGAVSVTEDLVWTEEARERLSNVPGFLREMVKRGVERYAIEKDINKITPDIMAELKKRAGR